MSRIVLVGFKASGKTSVGRELADMLGSEFIDTDVLIEKRFAEQFGERLSCREIFSQRGEEFFRGLEKEVLENLFGETGKHVVVALGGGALSCQKSEDITSMIKRNSVVVFLKPDKDVLFERIMKKGIPPFFDSANPRKSFEELFAERNPVFERVADVVISTSGLSVREVAMKIISEVGKND